MIDITIADILKTAINAVISSISGGIVSYFVAKYAITHIGIIEERLQRAVKRRRRA